MPPVRRPGPRNRPARPARPQRRRRLRKQYGYAHPGAMYPTRKALSRQAFGICPPPLVDDADFDTDTDTEEDL